MAKKVLILGIGESGVAAARHALGSGADVTIYAGKATEKTRALAAPFAERGVDVRFDTEEVVGHFDLCVVSPGIPQVSAFYQSALSASDELVSEPEYAWRQSPENWVAVTGTNGKTTTTTLIAHLLEACGRDVQLCGNTQGQTTMSAMEKRGQGGWIAAELSSFQLASTIRFAPRTAVLLNITSDHLAWHGSQEAYAAAKLKIFENLGPGQTAVVTDAVPNAPQVVDGLRARGVTAITVGARHDAQSAWAEDGALWFTGADGVDVRLVAADELQIKGAHNVENALAAAAVALDLGCDVDDVRAGLKSFEPLAHRIEPVGEVAGVAFYDDSKATNTDATIKALTAFPGRPIVLLLGGRDKGTDLSELVEDSRETCAAVVCYGEGGKRFYDAYANSGVPRELVGGMRDAFAAACRVAKPGEVVLLSPACASFDEFGGFAERGDVFQDLVEQRKRELESDAE